MRRSEKIFIDFSRFPFRGWTWKKILSESSVRERVEAFSLVS